MAITSTLYIYKNFTPNLGRGEHYYFDNIEDYMTAISSHLFIYENVDNYRITNLLLRLPYALPAAEYGDITYIIEKVQLDENNTLYHCYHVKNAVFVSNFMEFALTRDLWADYITKASLEHILLKRCNRHPALLPCAKFETLENATMYKTAYDLTNKYVNFEEAYTGINLNDVYIVIALTYEAYKQRRLFGDTITVSNSQLYAIHPKTLVPQSWQQAHVGEEINLLSYACQIITAIYGGRNGDTGDYNDAYVSAIWIVPGEFIPEKGTNDVELITGLKSLISDENIKASTGLYVVRPSFFTKKYSKTVKPHISLCFGTQCAMMELPRVFDNNNLISPYLEVMAKKDDLQIVARLGENQLDLSMAFSIGVPNATGTADAAEKIARGVSTIGALVGAGANFAAGNYVGGALSGALSIANAILPRDKSPNAQYKNNGDGFITWASGNNPSAIHYPIGFTPYVSPKGETCEIENVKQYGAVFNQYVSTIAGITQAPAIVNTVEQGKAYIQAVMDVENIPLDASEYIEKEFANGLELIEL